MKSLNYTTRDFQFDNSWRKLCAFDGCRIVLLTSQSHKHQVLNNRRYCSLKCLKRQYRGLAHSGAVHLVHQTFGPDHPVTKQIQEMYSELVNVRFAYKMERKENDHKIH